MDNATFSFGIYTGAFKVLKLNVFSIITYAIIQFVLLCSTPHVSFLRSIILFKVRPIRNDFQLLSNTICLI